MNKSNFSHASCFAAKVLDIQPGITAIIGGGGKTTLLYTLARELCQKGSVIVCTSTKIRAPQHIPLFSGESDADLLAGLQQFPVICAAQHTPNGKLCAPACSFAHLAGLADYVLVEADGSRQLPLKAHAAHEPVIPQGCGQVIYLVGADGFNRPISQVCHRPELFSKLTGTAPDSAVSPAIAARAILLEGFAQKVLINKVETARDWANAREFAHNISLPVFAGSLQQGVLQCL